MAAVLGESQSARIRRRLDHPVIDGDGHWLEPIPVLEEFLAQAGGAAAVDAFRAWCLAKKDVYKLDAAERKRRRLPRSNWWGAASSAIDRATALAPGLMYERLGEFGIDFALIYPTLGLQMVHIERQDLRHWCVRAYNLMCAEMFAPFADRLRPVALIPNVTPAEALEELEFAAGRGYKAAMMLCTVKRPTPIDAEWQPELARRRPYIDTLGLDAEYDYDPVWARFVELKMAVTTHAGSKNWSDRVSTSSHVANHLGHFAQSNHLAARSLFMGGVTHRFPELNFAFLEGGIGWACNLYSDLVAHWKKLNRAAMHQTLRPDLLDTAEVKRLLQTYGGELINRNLEALLRDNLDPQEPYVTLAESTNRNLAADEFEHVPISGPADIRRLFAEPFFFGCESDDPITAWAFDKRGPVHLKPVFSSDISHFDVTDMTEVLEEAYELVEDGLLDEDDFREFTFENAVQLHTRLNSGLFQGNGRRDRGSCAGAIHREFHGSFGGTFMKHAVTFLGLFAAIALASCGGAAAPATAPAGSAAAAKPASAGPASASAPPASASAKPAASGGASASGLVRINMSYPNVDMGHLHEWVAQDLGIFRDHGLDVHDELVSGSAAAMAALVSGQTNLSTGSSDAISAAASGVDLSIIDVMIPVYSYLLEVPPNIKTINDLKGAKVGVDSYGSAPDIAVRVALQKAGLDPDKDVSIIAVGNVPTRAAALLQGAIQATVINPPSSLMVEDKGFHPLINMAQSKLPNANGSTIGQRAWINANHDAVQRYVDSLILADQAIRKDKPGTIKIMEKYLKSNDERGMSAAYDFYVNDVYPTAPFPAPEMFADSLAELAKKNPALKNFDVSKILDRSFVQSAVDRGLTKS